MRNIRFWIPTIVGTLLTPFSLLAALVSTGAGHGSYGAMLVLYPLPALILVLFASVAPSDAFLAQLIGTLSMILVFGGAILQFPLYGFILSYAKLKGSGWLAICSGIIWVHFIAIGVWLVVTLITEVILKV
jgi:hypothetical protein